MSPPTILKWPTPWSLGALLGATLTASCLLTTPLDGLEGPPLSDGGAGDSTWPGDAESDNADASFEIDAAGNPDIGSSNDAPSRDADADGETKGPIRVTRVSGVLRGIAEHGLDVYWVQTDVNAGVARARKDGGGTAVFVETIPNAFDVAVDDDYVYWSTGAGNEVYRKSILADGASGTFYFSGARQTLYLAAGMGGLVYVTGFDSIGVGPQRDAGTSEAVYPFQSQPGAAGVAVRGRELYWSLDTGIARGSIAGEVDKVAELIYPGAPGEITGVATDGLEIFFIGAEGIVRAISLVDPGAMPREVCRGSIESADGESDVRSTADGGTSPPDIAVDTEWVYFTEPALRQISKCRK